MRLDRVLIAVPLLGGALLTGTAFAHGLGINPSVRDVIYPPSGPQGCQHNGLHVNKAGHSNCGLHKGWNGPPGTGTTSSGAAPTKASSGGHKADHASGQSGRPASHRTSGTRGASVTHGHANGHGHARGHGQAAAHGHGAAKGHTNHGG